MVAMDNKKAAPERIELPNGCYLSLTRSPMGQPLWYDLMAADDTTLFRGNGSTSGLQEQLAFAAAMQPTPSESDEAVAWLIELTGEPSPFYWGKNSHGHPEWLKDANTAVRFSRKSDAEDMIKMQGFGEAVTARRAPVAAPYGAEGLREALEQQLKYHEEQAERIREVNSTNYGAMRAESHDKQAAIIREALAQSPTIQAEGLSDVEVLLMQLQDTDSCHFDTVEDLRLHIIAKVKRIVPLPAAPKGE